jgi:hypothetical protein
VRVRLFENLEERSQAPLEILPREEEWRDFSRRCILVEFLRCSI